jgi:conjugal transfer/type IV secretion protein DotA/TraY
LVCIYLGKWARIVQNIRTRDVIAYATMPRVVPRVKDFFASGFGYIAFLMAQVFAVVRLLPENHPYLISDNVGRYGFHHVLAQAAKNITFSVKNIDQIIVFLAMIAGIVLLVVQFALLFYVALTSTGFALPNVTMFDTQYPQYDVAFNILHEIFGVPDIFCSLTVPTNCSEYEMVTAPSPLPFHQALHGLFKFYSTGLLLIAVLIFLYFMVVVIVETAATGTPFGQRFQNFWVPVRLIVALGLLVPHNYGLGSGQYIVLYAAKYASGFATNAWNAFNAGIVAHPMFAGTPFSTNGMPLGEPRSYLALPEAPDISAVIEAMSLVHACAYAYHRQNAGFDYGNYNETVDDGSDYQRRTVNYAQENATLGQYEVQAFLVKVPSAGLTSGQLGTSQIYGDPDNRAYIDDRTVVPYYSSGASTIDGVGFYYGSDIIIRFGEYRMHDGNQNDYAYGKETGYVKPLCGDIRIPVADLTNVGGSYSGEGGADHMQRFYYNLILGLWFNDEEMRQVARSLVEAGVEQNETQRNQFCTRNEIAGSSLAAISGSIEGFMADATECKSGKPSVKWRSRIIDTYTADLKVQIRLAWENYVVNAIYADFENVISRRGWGGAGIWYNKIAEINSGWMDGVNAVPYMERYPLVMEGVKEFKQQHAKNADVDEMFNPSIPAESENSSSKWVKVEGVPDDDITGIALPLYGVYRYWNPPNDGKNSNDLNNTTKDNPFINAIHMMLGTTGLVNIRKSNQHIHPLAQLVAVGKGLVNSAVLNMAGATTGSFLGGLLGGLKQFKAIAGAIDAASKMFYSVAFLGLTAGFVLFYVLPFMPFLYFFFSVANWVKAIFEAMLGAPLWALAHMRIDGEGLPGDAAANGYFLILEIFIRPILTVIAMLAAIVIFSTQVRILNLVWDMVTANAAGFTEVDDIISTPVGSDVMFFRRPLDQFFFTIVYTIVCYMLGMSSFKLIDKIPDNILRWAGAGVSAYGDIDQDNVESLSRYAAVGGMTIGNQAAGAVMQLGGGLGKSLGSEIAKTVPSSTPN